MSSFLFGDNYLALPRNPQRWLIEDLIPASGLSNLYGRPKTGKSYATLDMAEAISNPARHTWNGHAVLHHGPVAYLQIDTPRGEWAERIADLRTTAKRDFSQVAFADMQMVPIYPFNVLDPVCAKWLVDQIVEVKPVLIVIDTLREAHSGDENDNTVMRNVITQLVKAALPIGAAMLFLSHQKKDTQFMKMGGDDLMDDARGASYVSGRMDNVLRLTTSKLTWKGRSGAGDMSIMQDEDTHLIVLDQTAQKEADAIEQVILRERGLDPHVTIKDLAKALRVDLGWDDKKQKTAERRVSSYYKSKGWKAEKAKDND